MQPSRQRSIYWLALLLLGSTIVVYPKTSQAQLISPNMILQNIQKVTPGLDMIPKPNTSRAIENLIPNPNLFYESGLKPDASKTIENLMLNPNIIYEVGPKPDDPGATENFTPIPNNF